MDHILSNAVRDEIAAITANLDQAQTHLDNNRRLMSEDEAWELQARIDETRFTVEVTRLFDRLV